MLIWISTYSSMVSAHLSIKHNYQQETTPSVMDMTIVGTDSSDWNGTESVIWTQQYNGEGAKVINGNEKDFRYLMTRLNHPGRYDFKAKIIYKDGQDSIELGPISVTLEQRKELRMYSFDQSFVDELVHLDSSQHGYGTGLETLWEIDPPKNTGQSIQLEGSNVTFTPKLSGVWRILVKLVDSKTNTTVASAHKSIDIVWKLPHKPKIIGDRQVKSGLEYTYTVDPFKSSSDWIEEWLLPDGGIVEGKTAIYKPLKSEGIIQYNRWIRGHRNETEQTTKINLNSLDWEWPVWNLVVKADRIDTPAYINYLVFPTNKIIPDKVKQNLTYSVDLPEGATIAHQYNNIASIRFNKPGDHTVSITVHDDQNRAETLSHTIQISGGSRLIGVMDINVSDPWNRAPSSVHLLLSADNLEYGESIENIRYLVDGRLMYNGTKQGFTVPLIDKSGDYLIAGELKTNHGRKSRVSKIVRLIDGIAPSCQVKLIGDLYRDLEAHAECTTTMGNIRKSEWYFTFTSSPEKIIELGSLGNKIKFLEETLSQGIDRIGVSVTDDKGIVATAWAKVGR